MNRLVILFSALILFGCAEPKVDGSSQTSFENSAKKMAETLDPKDAEAFALGLTAFGMEGVDLGTMMALGTSGEESVSSYMRTKLDGKTKSEIIERGLDILESRRLDEISNLEEQKVQLRKDIEQFDVNKELEDSFLIESARFYYSDSGYIVQPCIAMTITNNLDQAVSRFYCTGKVQTVGRSIPWVEDTFNHEISGGLEPGETKRFDLNPNMFSDWANVPKNEEVVLLVRAYKVEGVGESIIFDNGEAPINLESKLEALKLIDSKLLELSQ